MHFETGYLTIYIQTARRKSSHLILPLSCQNIIKADKPTTPSTAGRSPRARTFSPTCERRSLMLFLHARHTSTSFWHIPYHVRSMSVPGAGENQNVLCNGYIFYCSNNELNYKNKFEGYRKKKNKPYSPGHLCHGISMLPKSNVP